MQRFKDFLIGFFSVFAFALFGTVIIVLFTLLSFYLLGLVESLVAIFVPVSCYYLRLISGIVFLFILLFLYSLVAYLAKEGPFKNW